MIGERERPWERRERGRRGGAVEDVDTKWKKKKICAARLWKKYEERVSFTDSQGSVSRAGSEVETRNLF